MVVKCKCGVSLFDNDIVQSRIVANSEFDEYTYYNVYRCPKCFLTTKRKVK